MITIRKSSDRGHADYGWLNTYHTFSFGRYHDSAFPGFGPLRVINEDRVAPNQGFGEHPHSDMEIISYVLSGELAHKDSLGHVRSLKPGEVQRMSAVDGIEHSEFNPSSITPVHFLQIWITPHRRGVPAAYDQTLFPIHTQPNTLHQIVSPDGADGSLRIQQDSRIFAGSLDAGASVQRALAPGRRAWVQLARGSATVNTIPLTAGDGAAVVSESIISISATEPAEVLILDLP